MSGPGITAGQPYPLGATWDGAGTNFALFSANATAVDLCLFDGSGAEQARIPLPERTDEVWHGHLADARPGTVYGYRVHGPWAPEAGHRFNPAKLLLDPYARALQGELRWGPEVYGHHLEGNDDRVIDARDSAAFVSKAVVTDPAHTWRILRPTVPWGHTVIYETHVRGFTMRHPAVPSALRGTYAGLGTPAVLDHIAALGVTTVELLPVHAFVHDHRLVQAGLTNFWGYNSLAFFAPHPAYAGTPGDAVAEFREMVARLHAAGLEVLLDVVYNHTAEGDETGPTLSFRGIDNASYYRLQPEGRHYVNDTGCGNTVNTSHPRVMQMVLDSLRFWATDMHVDGFRFDLAPVLGRGADGTFDALGPLMQACGQDPVLSTRKLVAEAWDLGPGGYQVGGFPPGWAEWNDRFRDDVRAFWLGPPHGQNGSVAALARRLSGSADLFEHRGRRPWATVNFVTAHDGFTLRDLVSYDRKHNDANGEGGRDGTDTNTSFNHGTEGDTNDPAVAAARQQAMRTLLATLLVSQGTPMLLAGDEWGRTQGGNNNPYCQDNETSWVDWDIPDWGHAQAAFVARLLRLRQDWGALNHGRFFTGQEDGAGRRDVTWLAPGGRTLADADWRDGALACFGMLIDGPAQGGTVLAMFNAGANEAAFAVPASAPPGWRLLLDTAAPDRDGDAVPGGAPVPVAGRSLLLLGRRDG